MIKNRQKSSDDPKQAMLAKLGALFVGAALFGIAVSLLLVPASIVTGGASGIATVLAKLADIPVGVGMIAVNLPLFILSIKDRGFIGMAHSVIGTVTVAVSADAFALLPPAATDPLLCALAGGAAMGAGSGLMLCEGITTGGSDLAAYLLRRKFRKIPLGRMILIFDTAIIVLSAVVLGNLGGIMYSVICTVTYSAALDMVQSATKRAKAAFIVTQRYASLAKEAAAVIDRGSTIICGRGGYTGEEKHIVMCVISRSEELRLRELVRNTDPEAFIIICDAACVLGEGFISNNDEI